MYGDFTKRTENLCRVNFKKHTLIYLGKNLENVQQLAEDKLSSLLTLQQDIIIYCPHTQKPHDWATQERNVY